MYVFRFLLPGMMGRQGLDVLSCLQQPKLQTGSVSPGRVAQLAGASPATSKGHGFGSGHGTHRSCGFDPWLGRIQEATNRCFSLTWMFLFLSPSLPSLYIFLKEF